MPGETDSVSDRPLTRIVERLDDPILLFALGGLIVVAGAAVSGAGSLRFTLPVAALALAAIAARVYLDVRRAPEGASVAASVKASLFGRVTRNRIRFGRTEPGRQEVAARAGGTISDNEIVFGDAAQAPRSDER